MNTKYLPKLKNPNGEYKGSGRRVDPNTWKTGPDELTREKYYAFLKHRAQCKFRSEPYNLSWEDWQTLWSDDAFKRRGRKSTDLCMARINFDLPWCVENCVVYPRSEHLKRNVEFRKND